MAPITPKFERINPGRGLRELISTRHLFELGKMLVKTTLLLAMLFSFIVTLLDSLVKAVYVPADDLLHVAALHAWHLMGWAALIYVLSAALDYAHQYYEFMKQQKMSVEELRHERREVDGDPRMKNRRLAIAREAILNPLTSRLVPASVVVVNPTHVAVALYYAAGKTPLPRVVAKGVDALARRIRAQAEREGVPVLEQPPLARRLFREVEVNHYISEALIDDVAAVFRLVRVMESQSPGLVRLAVAEAESHPPHRVDQPCEVRPVDLPAQPGDVHVNDVIERGGAPDVFPDLMP
jgi:type III secretion protein U